MKQIPHVRDIANRFLVSVLRLLRDRDNGLFGSWMTAVTLATLTLPLAGAAQTTYNDPHGRYDLQVPDGWHTEPDQGVDQIIVRKGAVQAIVFVIQEHTAAMTPIQFVASNAKEFADQCPTFRLVKKGDLTLAGAPGVYLLATCSDPKSPAVAETAASLSASKVLIGFTMIAPLTEYYANLPLLDGIRNSLHVMGGDNASAPPPSAESQAKSELERACTVGAFTQEDCARRIGLLLGREAKPGTASSEPAASGVYSDPQGRFSVNVPKDWNAISEGENGALGVQLRSGSNWINIMPAEPATSASEVVLHQEQKVAERSNSSRKIPFGTLGLIQLFGNGLEVTYDHFAASSMQGNAIETYIGGVCNIAGSDHNFLLLVASIGEQQKDKTGAQFLSVAQSIRLAAH